MNTATDLSRTDPSRSLAQCQLCGTKQSGGVAVVPGDVLVGDEDGVVVIPRAMANEVAGQAFEQDRLERFLQMLIANAAARQPAIGTYPANAATRREYEQWLADGEPDLNR